MMFHPKPKSVMTTLAAALALSMTLSGCVSFGSKPPSQLLSLSATQKVPVGALRTAASGASLTVADPDAPKMLDTVRVPVQVSPTSIAYVVDVQWADTPRHLFQQLLSETIGASTSRIVLQPGQYAASPGQKLTGELIDFGIDAQRSSAVVTFDATLVGPGGAMVARQRFTASAPVNGKIDAATVGAPLNAAANKVAADVAAWLATQGS